MSLNLVSCIIITLQRHSPLNLFVGWFGIDSTHKRRENRFFLIKKNRDNLINDLDKNEEEDRRESEDVLTRQRKRTKRERERKGKEKNNASRRSHMIWPRWQHVPFGQWMRYAHMQYVRYIDSHKQAVVCVCDCDCLSPHRFTCGAWRSNCSMSTSYRQVHHCDAITHSTRRSSFTYAKVVCTI